jgi:hypothetical protein
MVFIYIGMILLAAVPLSMVIWRMRKSIRIKKKGIATDAFVTGITTHRIHRATFDVLKLEYRDRVMGRTYTGKATVATGKNKRGDRMTVYYLPDDPSVMTPVGGKTYIPVLILCIILFLFVIFAVYKIDETVRGGSM